MHQVRTIGIIVRRLCDFDMNLYQLDKIQKRRTVCVPEGEGCADALLERGRPATTTPGGAKNSLPEHAEQLKAAGVENVVILPDNDDVGRAHAARLGIQCHAVGLQVKIVQIPGLPPEGDIVDFFGSGRTLNELDSLVLAAPMFSPPPSGAVAAGPAYGAVVRRVSDVPSERVSWLWRRRLARGKLTLEMGDPGVGKSFTTVDIASRVTRGATWQTAAVLQTQET